jgi:hypothetical protein
MAQVSPTLDELRIYNKQLIRLNSLDKIYGSASNNDFSISFASCGQSLSKVKKIGISNISFNNLFNNVASYNNSFSITYTDQTTTIPITIIVSIPQGYYNATLLAAAIQASVVLDAPEIPNFVCTFDTTTFRFSMDSGDPNYFIVLNDAVKNPVSNQNPGTLLYNIGWTVLPFGNTQAITAPYIPSLNLQNVYIFSEKLSSGKSYRSNNGNSSILGNQLLSIPLYNTVYGGTCNWISSGNNERGTIIYNIEQQLDQIDMVLLGDYGNVLESPENSPVMIEFIIYY